VIKTDAEGTLLNQQSYGGVLTDEAAAIEKTDDGGFIVAGKTNNTGSGENLQDALLLKIGNNLAEEWMRRYGVVHGEKANGVKQTFDGGYVFAGSQAGVVNEVFFQDVYLAKTDADGNLKWEKTYDGGSNDTDDAKDIITTNEGEFLLAGFSTELNDNVYVIKTDSSGEKLWSQIYDNGGNDQATAIIQTKDSDYLIAGYTSNAENESRDLYILKMDDSGNQLWDMRYGGKGGEAASSVREETPEGYIISGSTSSFSNSNDMYILKIDSDGMIGE
jgi:hypothetical protein